MTGCGNNEAVNPAENGIPMESAASGLYIYKASDKLIYKSTTSGQSDEYWWFVDGTEKEVTELGAKDQLVYVNMESRPTSITFTRYDELGWTIGTSFDVITETTDQKDSTIITFGGQRNPLSPISSYLNGRVATTGENVKIKLINNKDFKLNMLTEDGFIKGLSKGAMYKLSLYEGTYYKDLTICADSYLMYANGTYISQSYTEMESNYFIIKIPSDMPNGYYYAEGLGLFKYTGHDTSIDDKTISDDNSTANEETDTTEQ